MVGVANGRCGEWSVWRMVGLANGRCGEWSVWRMVGVANGRFSEWPVWRMVGVANGRVDSGALWMGGPGDGDLREIPSQLILRIDHRCILQEELENDLPY